ncbi:MAG TPA: hypothetical protein VGB23_02575 [Nitrospirota bacterium]
MDQITGLAITVRVDTADARREVEEFRRYALGVIEELRAAYAAAGQLTPSGDDGGGRRA